MYAQELEGCCALQVIYALDALSNTDAYSKQEQEEFDRFLAHEKDVDGCLSGANVTTSIVTISPLDLSKAEFTRQRTFLKKHGMRLIGKFPGGEQGKRYWIELWGSKEFRIGGRNANSRNGRARRPRKADARGVAVANRKK